MIRLLTLFIQRMMPHKKKSEDEEDESSHGKLIKSTNKFLAIIDQQKAFMKRNKLPVKLVEQLETLIVGNQIALCNEQKEMTDYFKSFHKAQSQTLCTKQ